MGNLPIRVLHVFGRLDRGGAETAIMNVYRHIDLEKVQFDFIVHTEDCCSYDEEILSMGGKLYHVPAYQGINHFTYKKWWYNFFKENQGYKIIHSHVRSTATIYLKIAKKYGLCTIAHSHSTSSGRNIRALIKNIFQYSLRNIPDYLFACSQNSGEWLYGKKAIQNDNYFVIKNAIEIEKFIFNLETRNRVRKQFNIEDKLVLGHVGRFNVVKNHRFLIKCFKAIYEKNNNSVLMLVGTGDLYEDIRKQIADLELIDHVIFTGIRADIHDILQAMDIFLFPSYYEGFPVTLIEAQSSGLPIIASDTITKEVALTDLVNYLSLKTSAEKWADFIIDFIGDNRHIERKSYYNIMNKSEYNVERTVKWLEEFYLKLIKQV